MLATILLLLILGPPGQTGLASTSRELLDRIWVGVDRAETQHSSGCGTLTETRTSPLLASPLVLRGRFCALGLDRFRVEYDGPDAPRVVFNQGTLNVTTVGGEGRRTEVLKVGNSVKRAQRYFSGPDAPRNLERDFAITVCESSDRYVLTLRPVSGRLAHRIERVLVELGKSDFLPRRIEVDGTSRVDSVFDIRVEQLDAALDDSEFEVYHPRSR